MDCQQCAENLTAFLDSELGADESEQVRSHVSRCRSCAEELQSLREAAEFIESHIRECEVPPTAWNLLRAQISLQSPSPSPLPSFLARWRVAVAATALAAALMLGYTHYQQVQQRKTLDQYMSQYIREREASRRAQPSTPAAAPYVENPYAGNPFIEVRATDSDNPFRSEDR